jgi:hypothetical protein
MDVHLNLNGEISKILDENLKNLGLVGAHLRWCLRARHAHSAVGTQTKVSVLRALIAQICFD